MAMAFDYAPAPESRAIVDIPCASTSQRKFG